MVSPICPGSELPACINQQSGDNDGCCCPEYSIDVTWDEGSCVTIDGRTYWANCTILAGTPFVVGKNGATWREDHGGATVVSEFNSCRTYLPDEMVSYDGKLWIAEDGFGPGAWDEGSWTPYGGGEGIIEILPGTDNVEIDATDPQRPIISVTSEGTVKEITGNAPISVDNSDPENPVINFDWDIATVEETRAAAVQDKLMSVQLFEEASAIVTVDPAAVNWDLFWAGEIKPEDHDYDILITNPTNVQIGTKRDIIIRSETPLPYRLEFGDNWYGEIPDNDCSCCEYTGWLWLQIIAHAEDYIIVHAIDAGKAEPVVIDLGPLPNDGFIGTAYGSIVTANGGFGPYTFALTAGSLPTGLSLAANGNVSGTPTVPGSYIFTITATDSMGNQGFRQYEIIVISALGNARVTSVAYSPLLGRVVTTGNSEAFKYSPDGKNWFDANIPDTGGTAIYWNVIWSDFYSAYYAFRTHPITGGAFNGVMKSVDGENWNQIATLPGNSTLQAGCSDDVHGTIVITQNVAGSTRIYRSTDGDNFNSIAVPGTVWTSGHFAVVNQDGRMFFGAGNNPFTSTDGALSFTSFDSDLVGTTLTGYATHGSRVVLSTGSQVQINDNSTTWDHYPAPVGNLIMGIEWSSFLAKYVGFDYVSNNGIAWIPAPGTKPPFGSVSAQFARTFASADDLGILFYANVSLQALWQTTDGANWTKVT